MRNFYLFLFFLSLSILNGYFFNYLNDQFFHIESKLPAGLSENELAFLAVFIGPLIETFLCQYLLYKLLKRCRVESDLACILIMSFAFSQLHWYNWLYVIMAFFGGLILNTCYVTFLKRTRFYFILTVLLHALYNLYGVLFIH